MKCIISVLLNVDGCSHQTVNRLVHELNLEIVHDIKYITIPVTGQPTSVQCVYPPPNLIINNDEKLSEKINRTILDLYKYIVENNSDQEVKDILKKILRLSKIEKISDSIKNNI